MKDIITKHYFYFLLLGSINHDKITEFIGKYYHKLSNHYPHYPLFISSQPQVVKILDFIARFEQKLWSKFYIQFILVNYSVNSPPVWKVRKIEEITFFSHTEIIHIALFNIFFGNFSLNVQNSHKKRPIYYWKKYNSA